MAQQVIFEASPAVFYAAVWITAYLANYSRVIRTEFDLGYRHCLRRSLFGGFLGFATIAVLRALWPDYSDNGWHLLGVAALVGLLGSEQQRILAHIANKVMDFIGVPKDGDSKARGDGRGVADLGSDSGFDLDRDHSERARRDRTGEAKREGRWGDKDKHP